MIACNRSIFALLVQLTLHIHYFVSCTNNVIVSVVQAQSPANNEQPFASILYTAVVRGKVALPCDITPPTSDDSVALILWYKDDALAPIYTLDARKGDLDQARTLTAPSLDARAYFNLNNRPAFLQIDPIRLTDAGDYRCRVDFKKARTVNTVISLKVIVPPEEPQISNVEGFTLKGLVGPFNEGEALTLICTTNGGKPRPSLVWWRDFTVIDDTFEYNDKDVTTNQVTIPSLARHHLLSIFMCQAINNNITVPSSTSITLDLNLKPTEVQITQLTPILVTDREATFECQSFGSRPKAILYWIFDGQRHNTPLNGSDHQTRTTITITPKQSHNGEPLTCVAENSKIPNSAISDQLKLDVQYIPNLTLKLGVSTISLAAIQEGNDIYFDCHIDSNPLPNKPIIWRFNGNVIQHQTGIIQSNQSLVLQRVSRTQSGEYQCEASNQQGTALSNSLHLKIRFAPVCKSDATLVYGLSLHETVHLVCDVEANPPQVSFSWRFDKETDLITSNQINDTSSILVYTPHSMNEFGSIECIAKNEVGLQQNPCTFDVITGGAPQFPFNCQVVNQSDNALIILCMYTIRNNRSDIRTHYEQQQPQHLQLSKRTLYVYPQTHYICEVYHYSSSYLVANVTTSLTLPYSSSSYIDSSSANNLQFLVNNLNAATNFKLKIFAQNSKGRSEEVTLKAHTLRPAERLIDRNMDTVNNSLNNVNGALFRGKPMLIALLVAIGVVTLIVIALGAIAVIRVRRGNHADDATPPSLQPPNCGQSTLFNEEEEDCCCDDDCCDEMLLTSTNVQQQNVQLPNNSTKGPPDIIPSFGYSSANLENKQYMSFDYNQDLHQCETNGIQYAELSFAERGQQAMHKHNFSQPVEYAEIKFPKTPRVNVIGGSPKYESTV